MKGGSKRRRWFESGAATFGPFAPPSGKRLRRIVSQNHKLCPLCAASIFIFGVKFPPRSSFTIKFIFNPQSITPAIFRSSFSEKLSRFILPLKSASFALIPYNQKCNAALLFVNKIFQLYA
jgi:hypothetical protein